MSSWLTKSVKSKYFKKIGLLALAVIFLVFNILFATPSHAWYEQIEIMPYRYRDIYYTTYDFGQLTITTARATNITDKSAILNALVNGSNLYNTYNLTTWFEYGPNLNLGYSTLRHSSNSGYANFSANIAGLTANTIYYFRAITQRPQGIIYGDINTFRTDFSDITLPETNNDSNNLPSVTAKPPTTLTAKSTAPTSRTEALKTFSKNNSFLPVTILGWLVLIILILFLILVIKHLYHKFSHRQDGR